MLAEFSDPTQPNNDLPASNDWSPEQETALLLDLCEAQLEAAMRDSDRSIDTLVGTFTDLVEASRVMNDLLKQSPTAPPDAVAVAEQLKKRASAIAKQINEVIVSLQFYDKLTQRLGHVRHSLTTLALFISNRTHAQQRDHWHKLLTSLRRLYRTQEERAVFDLVAEGRTADEVRANIAGDDAHAAAGSIELF